MSLLLDALKKAADDKHTTTAEKRQLSNTGTDTELDIPMLSDSDTSTNLELELNDEFPQVDDKSEERKNLNSPTEKPEQAETPHTLEEISNTPETSSNIIPSGITNTTPEASSDKHNEHARQKRITENINNEQALSALIDKSNQFTRKQKRKKTVIISLLTILLLISSALYFYIEIQLSRQSLYIADNVNSSEVSHNPTQTQTIKPLVKPVQAELFQQQKTHTTNTNSIQTTKLTKSDNKPDAIKQQSSLISKPEIISIVHSKKIDPLHAILNDAYIAFNKQNYKLAEDLYNEALLREPNNRDALLGLAAIASTQKRFGLAQQKYQYLLKLNPRDSIAIAGMSNMRSHIDPQLNESQLKFMLKQQPDSAHLYFALGSHYSAQSKWPEAQSAFFSAWSADNKNADYAYNLAVSLDHLNKQKQAMDFYQLSLKLQKPGNRNFTSSDVHKRISSIQAHLK